MNEPANFFKVARSGADEGREIIATLFQSGEVRIERVESNGQASPEGFWYDQGTDEWVMLVRGNAALEFENGKFVELACGDCVSIAKHVRHRVARTSADALWLAVHFGQPVRIECT